MGWLSDKLFGKRKTIDINKLKAYQQPTQNFINQQSGFIGEGMGQAHEMFGVGRNMLGMGQEFMDPNSQRNVGMRGLLQQIAQRQASDQGAQIGSQMMRMGAMSGVSPGQAMMQSRMAQNQAMGGVNDKWQDMLQKRFGQGVGLMNNMIQAQSGMASQQQGLDENIANAYVQQVNAHNARRNKNMGMGMSLLGGVVGGFGGAGAGWSGAGFNSNMFG